MSFQFELDPREEASAALIADTARHLRCAINQYRDEHAVSQSEIAEALGADKAFLSKCLSGVRNITLKTLSDIAWAVGGKVEINIVMPEALPSAQVYDLSAFQQAGVNTVFAENSLHMGAIAQLPLNGAIELDYAV